VDAELLISFIEERPVLWDRTSETCKDKNSHWRLGGKFAKFSILISSHWTKEKEKK
jgi:hypothetical protein